MPNAILALRNGIARGVDARPAHHRRRPAASACMAAMATPTACRATWRWCCAARASARAPTTAPAPCASTCATAPTSSRSPRPAACSRNTAAGLGQQFTDDELEAIVQAAHAMGRQVTAHAHGVDGINSFLRAGGDSIEHGTFADAESARLFKAERRLSGPHAAGRRLRRCARRTGPAPSSRPPQTAKAREAGPKMLDMLRRMHAGRREDRLRHRHRRLGPRRQRAGVRPAGAGRHDAAGGHPGRHRQRRRPFQPLGRDRLRSRPARPPTSSPSTATRWRTCASWSQSTS